MTLPTTFRSPFFSVGVDPSKASRGPSILPYRVLLVGGRISAGTVLEKVLTRVTSEAQARTYFGEGSQLHLMVRAFLANNKFVMMYCMALNDNGAGTAATKTLTVTGTATAAGTFYVYIGGRRIPVVVASGDVQNTVAAAINTAISATADLPMTNAVTTNVVTVTARNKGEPGTDIDVRTNYGEGEAMPTGVAVAVANGTAGATNPDITGVFTAIGDEWFQIIAAPYADATNLGVIEAELDDRFAEIRQIPTQYICCKDANLAGQQTFGEARNSPHVRCLDFYGIPWTPSEWCASWAAVEAASAQNDPAQPQFRQEVKGLGAKPPMISERRTLAENNSLLYSGISTFTITTDGKLQIGRAITMYQKNAAGAEDTAYLRAETMYTLMYMRYDWNNQFAKRFPRAKLAKDGAFVPAGQSFITPSTAKAFAVEIARGWEQLGIMENVEQFKNDLVFEIDPSDPDRLNSTISPDTVNQFVVGAAIMQFVL